MQQCCRTVLVEQWNSESGTLWWNSGTVMVEQGWWNSDGRTVRWDSGTVTWKSGIVEQCWWHSVVQQRNSVGGIVEQCLFNSGTVEQ